MAAFISDRIIKSITRGVHTKATLISKRIIKPLSPTPESFSCYKLSSSDQTIPCIYVPFAFFYPAFTNGFSRPQISEQIQNSLSKALTYYYPFAGRLVGNDHVICNDAGVEFQEVQVDHSMSEILENSQEDVVFPRGLQWKGIQDTGNSLVVVRLNHFDCGGVAIAVCISHKIADASTLATFVNDFATLSRGSNRVPSPEFIGYTIFPPLNNAISFPSDVPTDGVSRRYVFDLADIEKLKIMAADNFGVEKPTRVEVVTAFLYQRLLIAASRSDSGSVHPSILIYPMNLRALIGSPLQHNSLGNLWAMNMLVTEKELMNIPKLVRKLRNSKVELENVYKKKLNSASPLQDMLRSFVKTVSHGDFHVYHCSSNCRIPFYEVDFGWGKPVRVTIGQYPARNTIFLMDTSGNNGGIEALISLDEETMSRFEHDKEFLRFAYSYPK